MFQFRPFPTYYYFIHSTLLRYCRSGFPHSDISGSMLICSSPKLFAACRVLHRLLMPRHSPCALFSLTYVRVSSLHSALVAQSSYPLPSSSFSKTKLVSFLLGRGRCFLCLFLISLVTNYSCSRIMQAQQKLFFYTKLYLP